MPTFNNKDTKVKSNFSRISISLASPEDITARSCGEVLKPETVNYRTYKPERDGLFCEKIFGPTRDYECYCGKYKRIRYRGIVCDRCGVEVTEKKVRRERMGHITLTVPVAHIWYFKSAPNKISALLGIPSKKLESVIYYEKYIVIKEGAANDKLSEDMPQIAKYDLLSEDEYQTIMDRLPDNYSLSDDDPAKFIAKMGAEGIYDLLKEIDVDELGRQLRQQMRVESSQQRKNDILKRLTVVKWFQESKEVNRPEWMIMKVIPVTPPDLRPLVPLDGGRFATSDLNDLSTTPRSPARSRASPTGLSSLSPIPSRESRDASARTSSERGSTTPHVRSSSSVRNSTCMSADFRNSWLQSFTSRSLSVNSSSAAS